jgi:PAS domain S-box-containing protein
LKESVAHTGKERSARRWHDRAALFYLRVAVLIGIFCTVLTLQNSQRRMRAELLARARSVAAALNAERVKGLSGEASDLDSAVYQRLKAQLNTLKKAYADVRFIYLMGRTASGELFFMVDNEGENSPAEALPGQPYPEAPLQFRKSLALWQEMVDGPVQDRWGSWHTALVPVRDPLSGEALAMLGVDIATADWRQRLLREAAPVVGITVVIALIILAAAILHRREQLRISTSSRVEQRLGAGTVAIIGVTLSLFIAQRVYLAEKRQREQIFSQLAAGFTDNIAKNLRHIRFVELKGLSCFLQHKEELTREEFHLYAGHLVKNSLVQAWEFIKIVPQDERDGFEEAIRRQGHSEFCIWEHDEDLQKIPAADRHEHYPVLFFAPEAGNETIFGYDLASEALRLEAINKTMSCGLASTSEPLALIQDWDMQKSILALQPVFHPDMDKIRGFAVAAIHTENILGYEQEAFRLAQLRIELLRADGSAECLAQSADENKRSCAISHRQPLLAFGEVFLINAEPRRDFLAAYPLRQGWIVLLAGLGISLTSAICTLKLKRQDLEIKGIKRHRDSELYRSRKRFCQLAIKTRTLHWECDLNGLFVAVGDECKSIIGYEPKELIGKKRVFDLHPEEQREEIKNRVLAAFSKKESVSEEIKPLLCKDGRVLSVAISSMPIFADDGSLLGYYGIARDVSERENMHAELMKSRSEAEAANRAKSNFLTNMSHEIRTPINGIVGVADLLQESGLSQEQSEFVDIINSSSRLLLELINEILDFSRIEAGQLKLMLEDFSLERLLEELCDSLSLLAHNKKIELYWHSEPGTPFFLRGDAFHLRQTLVNLCSNAIKFTEQGEVSIHVSCEEQRGEQALIRFAVRDTGIGIADEQQSQIFESFSQADESIKRRFGGSGLGLPIVKRLVELMGGQIKLKSKNGSGSEFYFSIPLTQQSPQPPTPSLPQALLASHILLVEKHEGLQQSLQSRLQQWGIASTAVATLAAARDAMQKTDTAPFTLLLLDATLIDQGDEQTPPPDLDAAPWNACKVVGMAHVGSPLCARFRAWPSLAAFVRKPIKNNDLLMALTDAATKRKPSTSRLTAADKGEQQGAVSDGSAKDPSSRAQMATASILVVDDNEVNVKVALAIIGKMGLEVDAASSGQQALTLLANKKYNLVLMDVLMPELDGLQTTRLLREQQATALNHDVPVIAMTAHDAENYQQQCQDAGMDDYICKPISANIMRECISRWLSNGEYKRIRNPTACPL